MANYIYTIALALCFFFYEPCQQMAGDSVRLPPVIRGYPEVNIWLITHLRIDCRRPSYAKGIKLVATTLTSLSSGLSRILVSKCWNTLSSLALIKNS